MQINFKKLSNLATVPTKNSGDAGYDLYSTEDYILKPLERKLFKTNIAIAIPEGYYGRIAPRSGLAYKYGIDVMAGVIDSTYLGDVGIILINLSTPVYNLTPVRTDFSYDSGKRFIVCESFGEYEIKKGDRIAQIIFEKYHEFEFTEVKELDETVRGQSGFGDSGR